MVSKYREYKVHSDLLQEKVEQMNDVHKNITICNNRKCVKWGFYMWGICNVGAIILRNFGGQENVSSRWTTRQATKCGSLMVGGNIHQHKILQLIAAPSTKQHEMMKQSFLSSPFLIVKIKWRGQHNTTQHKRFYNGCVASPKRAKESLIIA